jgi:hypothetical protein
MMASAARGSWAASVSGNPRERLTVERSAPAECLSERYGDRPA